MCELQACPEEVAAAELAHGFKVVIREADTARNGAGQIWGVIRKIFRKNRENLGVLGEIRMRFIFRKTFSGNFVGPADRRGGGAGGSLPL